MLISRPYSRWMQWTVPSSYVQYVSVWLCLISFLLWAGRGVLYWQQCVECPTLIRAEQGVCVLQSDRCFKLRLSNTTRLSRDTVEKPMETFDAWIKMIAETRCPKIICESGYISHTHILHLGHTPPVDKAHEIIWKTPEQLQNGPWGEISFSDKISN